MRVVLLAFGLAFGSTVLADTDSRLAETAKAIEKVLASSPKPGLIIGVTDRHTLRKVIVHGYADLKTRTPLKADSRLAIGSISKAFTSVALLQLADEQRFDVHAPITRYLPWLDIHSRFAAMTGHDLMSHTAGLPYYLTDSASSRFAGLELKEFEPPYAPGAHWQYSNTGYQLLGYALENIEGARFSQVIRRRVLEPLGMANSSSIIDDAERARMTTSYARWPYDGKYVEAPWFEYTAGDGSIVSTVSDMSAYTRFILNRGRGPSGRVLSERAFAALTTPVLDEYGYGLWIRQEGGHTVISHGGGIAGFRSHIEAHMDEGFALVFLSNGGIGEPLRKWVTEAVAAAFADRAAPPPMAPERDPLAANVSEYAGSYAFAGQSAASPGAKMQFIVVKGTLVLKGAGADKPLQRIGIDAFRIAGDSDDYQAYIFTRTANKTDGKVVEVSHGAEWYVTKEFTDPVASSTPDYSAFVGHYVYPGPEGPVGRIFVRSGELVGVFAWEEQLFTEKFAPIGPGEFRVGQEDFSPERARFDGIVDGHAQRLIISGVPLYRRETQ
jgi:D-alanyl-D-alanine carboxypeptidase